MRQQTLYLTWLNKKHSTLQTDRALPVCARYCGSDYEVVLL